MDNRHLVRFNARACVANPDNLLTIPKTWLEARIAPLPADKLEALDAALKFVLALA